MKKKNTPTYREKYPSLFDAGVLTDEMVESQKEFYEANKDDFADQLESHTHTIDMPDGQFRGVVVRGEAPETIVIGGEYGNANTLPAYVRAMGIRALSGSEASVIILPNNTLGEDNLGLTNLEQAAMHQGSAEPYIHRFKRLLERTGTSEDQPVHIVGMSLGAATGAALAAEHDVNTRSLTLIEPPHLDGNIPSIMAKFVTSGGQLAQNIAISKQAIEKFDAIDGPNILGLARFGLGSLTPSNLASLGLMRNRDIDYDLLWTQANHGSTVGIVNAYDTEAHVSPVAENRRLAEQRRPLDSSRFESYELTGADHSVTNAHAVVAALAKRAKELGK